MRQKSHISAGLTERYRGTLHSRLVQFVFILGLIIAVSLVVASGNISTIAAIIFGFIFIWVAFTNLKAGIFLAIIFTNFQPFLERLLLLAGGGTFGGNMVWGNMFRTSVSLSILLLAAFYFAKKVIAREKILEFSTDKYIFIYLGWCLLETLNPNQSALVGVYGFKQELIPLLMFFLAREFFQRERDLRVFLKYMIFYATISCLYALYQHFYLTSFDALWVSTIKGTFYADPAAKSGIRAFAFATGDMPFLFPLVAILIIIAALGGRFFDKKWRWGILLLYVSIALMAVFQLPRTPVMMIMVGLTTTWLLIGYIKGNLVRTIFIMTLAVLIIAQIFLYFIPYLQSSQDLRLVRFSELANPMNADTVRFRQDRPWKEAISLISLHPLGIGVGSGRRTRPGIAAKSYYLPHNEFLMKWLELGLPGLIFYSALLIKIAAVAITAIWKGKQTYSRRYAAGILGVLFAYIVCAMVNIPFLDESGIFFWFMAGVLLLLPRFEFQQETIDD